MLVKHNTLYLCSLVAVQSPANRMPSAVAASRGVNGKRKLPTNFSPTCNPAGGSMPVNSAPHFMNFALEKRPCRPDVPMQKQEANYSVKNYAGLSHADQFCEIVELNNSSYFHTSFSMYLNTVNFGG